MRNSFAEKYAEKSKVLSFCMNAFLWYIICPHLPQLKKEIASITAAKRANEAQVKKQARQLKKQLQVEKNQNKELE